MGKPRKEIDGATKARNPKNKRFKRTIVFNEEARNDWLTGFSKRKSERRKRAQHQEIERLKEEKRQLKKKKREERAEELESLREAVGQVLPTEIDTIAEPQVYNLPSHTVTVVDVLDPNFTGRSGLRLGLNDDKDDKDEEEEKADTEETETTDKSKQEDQKSQKQTKKSKGNKKPRKNRSHLMDRRVKKKKAQVPNKWTRMHPKKK